MASVELAHAHAAGAAVKRKPLPLRVLDHLEELIILLLMAAATLVTFTAVAHRFACGVSFLQPYLLGINLGWAQELCIYMFVWMAKFGAAYGVRTGVHVGVDLLVNKLPPHLRKKVVTLGLCGGALFTSIVGTMGAKFVWELSHTDSTSPDLEVPVWIVYLAIPLGSYLMCFRFLQVIVAFWRTGELPHHDAAHVEGIEEFQALTPTPAEPKVPVAAAKAEVLP